MNRLQQKIDKAVALDILLIIIFNIIMFAIFAQVDLLEKLYHYSLEFEFLELDEIVPLFFTIAISFLLFGIRRYRELQVILRETTNLSLRDHLTGLYNRRFIEQIFYTEIARIKRKSSTLSMLIIDIDNFKKINDQYGHNVGDEVLFQFSTLIQSIVRKTDTPSRWGGEEFLILCQESDINEAISTAERLLAAFNEYQFYKVGKVTASIGVTSVNNEESFEYNVNQADKYLYQAKSNGKNCYVSA